MNAANGLIEALLRLPPSLPGPGGSFLLPPSAGLDLLAAGVAVSCTIALARYHCITPFALTDYSC